MRINRFSVAVLFLLLFVSLHGWAQTDKISERSAQWNGYALPTGEYTRYSNKEKGFSLWHPSAWTERKLGSNTVFSPSEQERYFLVVTETLPEGYGVASYANSLVQQFRKQPVDTETISVRSVLLGGVEAREINTEMETDNGQVILQSYWVTQVGATGFAFVLTTPLEKKEQLEPYFKRLLHSVRFHSIGHWDEDFETLRTKFSANNKSAHDGAGAQIGEALRTAKISSATAREQITNFAKQAPEIGLEMLTDYDPNVRAAALFAIGKIADPRWHEALIWGLTDKDAFSSTTAAQMLAAHGTSVSAKIKTNFPQLVKQEGALLRYAALVSDDIARGLAEELLQSNEPSYQLTGLQIAMLLPLNGFKLPYEKLFTTKDVSVISHALEVIRLRRPIADEAAFVKMIGTDMELWAIHVLGEIGAPAVTAQLATRKNALEVRYQALLKSKGVITVRGNTDNPPPPPPPMPKRISGSKKTAQFTPPRELPKGFLTAAPGMFPINNSSPASTPPGLFKAETELTKLWSLVSELEDALSKIKWREQWAAAKTKEEREKILAETKQSSRLEDWAKATLKQPAANISAPSIDGAKLKNAVTTGETIFPQQATLYLTAPNFEATINKLDAALTGIQMGTVRDQMTFALMLNNIKAQLANKMNLAVTGSATSTLGIDLRAPVSMAAWADRENANAFAHSAVVLRVTDRARFERTLTMYQADFGDFDSFVPMLSAGARFASITPAILPVAFYAIASVSDFAGTVTKSGEANRVARPALFTLESAVYARQEKAGDVPITVFEKLAHVGIDATTQTSVYVAYLGDTAVLAPDRESLLQVLDTAKTTIAESKSYRRIKGESGEMIYYSQLGQILDALFNEVSSKPKNANAVDEIFTAAFKKAFDTETGAMRLSASSWESVFQVPAADTEFAQTLRPFNATELSAPRELLPASTLFYATTVIDPTKFAAYMEKLDAEIKAAEKVVATKNTEKIKAEKAADNTEALQKLLLPHAQGEIAVALLSLANVFDPAAESSKPAFAITLKLKNDTLAKTARAGLASFVLQRVPDVMALQSPVFKLSAADDAYVAVFTDQYFVVADSVASLRLLEGKEKFASVRDFARPASIAPEKLALFSTYNLDAAFAEARNLLGKRGKKTAGDDTTTFFIDAMSAWAHAFHSQRLLVAFTGEKNLEGQLGVSFDREGNFNVGAMSRNEFDLENALIAPTGVNIQKATRVESLRIKVAAKQPGVITRVQEDLSKFPWHKIEAGTSATSLIFTVSQRRIPENLTIKLPVRGAEFEPYLSANGNINSTAPEIIKLAKEIVGKEKDGRKIAAKIGAWTYENLKWKRVTATAAETLASREADCLEHAELYTALARAVGLPARVVSGAAFGDGTFGAHAWVEVYLGKWVELDPTWGLLDYVDATHLRFAGNEFITYAQLNQTDFEILAAHSAASTLQRDPLQLVQQFGTEESVESLAAVFDLELTAQQVLSAEVWNKQTPKQRTALTRAFNKAVNSVITEWSEDWDDNPLIITQEIKADQATIDTIIGDGRMRFTLALRNGLWYITEVENVDAAARVFAEPLQRIINPELNLAAIRNLQTTEPDQALKLLEKLIAVQGETAPLLLLRAEILAWQETAILGETKEALEKKADGDKAKSASANSALVAYRQLTKRWPDYAPGHYALGLACANEAATYEEAIQAMQAYARLSPLDPRPWREMGSLYEELQRRNEAENALRQALRLDSKKIDSHTSLIAFLLRSQQLEKAKDSLAVAFRENKDFDAVLFSLDWDILHGSDEVTPESAQQFEQLLLGFPKELAGSVEGLRALAEAQRIQKKYENALKTLQRVVALAPDKGDQATAASIYRETKSYPQALVAANLAIKQDSEYTEGYYERACALTKLGRKREALADLKKAIELNKSLAARLLEEDDLQALRTMSEFKALLPKEETEENNVPKP